MEIDRIEGRGRGKGGKGKSKTDKGNAKGKSKSKSKDKGKGKNSSYDGGGKSGKGKSVPNQGKKGGKGDKSCYVCGKSGHYARDCWQNQSVRSVEAKVNQIKARTQVKMLVNSLRPSNLLQIKLPNIELHEFLS